MKQTKYIFVTGGVTSSLGKGIIAVSLAKRANATKLTSQNAASSTAGGARRENASTIIYELRLI